jgi:hypothetical protein
VGGTSQQGRRVLAVEVGCELADAGEVEAAVGQHVQEERVLARGSGGGDEQIGFRLGEVQDLFTVREHRRTGFASVEPSLVDLGDVGHEVGLDAARLAQKLGETREQLVVGNGVERVSLHE